VVVGHLVETASSCANSCSSRHGRVAKFEGMTQRYSKVDEVMYRVLIAGLDSVGYLLLMLRIVGCHTVS
jgi:hypothetical protein